MLVQNGFADAGAIGDLVHACGVVTAVDEHLAGSDQQLSAPLVPGGAGYRAGPRWGG